MKKIVLMMALVLALSSSAQADIIFSTSNTDANAGSDLSLANVGDTGTLYVWVSTAPGSVINGMSVNINSADASILQATSHVIYNPNGLRWNGVTAGALGDLVTDFRTVGLFAPFGLGTSGLNDFALFSEVNFTATAEGTTNLGFSQGPLSVTYRGGSTTIWNTWTIGTGSVTVGSAIPEPSSAAIIGLLAVAGFATRRRK